jgi:HK97 family phage prohead protease
MERFIELPRGLRGGEFRAQSFDEASNTIEVCWTTGATVRRQSWLDGPYDEELLVEPGAVRLERLNAGAAFLDTHSSWSCNDVLGSVVPGSARLQGGEGVARVQLTKAESAADTVQKIKEGVIRSVSVGYMRHKVEKIESDDGKVPIWRVVDWEPYEISAVPVPADSGAQIRSSEQSADAMFRCIIRDGSPESHVLRTRMSMRARAVGIKRLEAIQ